MTLKTLFLLVLSFALLTKGRSAEPEYDVTHIQTAYDCPPYNSYGYDLLARKLGCNDDKPMHCAQLLGSEIFTVRCLKPKLCTQGQQPFIQDGSDTVSCRFCSGDTYNTVPSQPSYFYPECTPMTKLDRGRIPCEHLELRTSDPDYNKYNRYIRCNVSAGYILDDQSVSDPSRDRQGYCTNSTDPRCIKYSCEEGYALAKNYSCVKKCSSDEVLDKNLNCIKNWASTSTTPLTTPGRPVVTKDKSSAQSVPPTVTQTTEPMKSESTLDEGIIAVCVVAVVGIVGLVTGFIVWSLRGKDCVCCACSKNREINQNQKSDNEVDETEIPFLGPGSQKTGGQHVTEIDETTIDQVVDSPLQNAPSSNPSKDKKRSQKDERPSKNKRNGNKSPNDTENYPYPWQETKQSSGPTTQENIDNERRQSISEPETRQVKTDGELSMDTPGDNDETFVKLVVPAEKSDRSSKSDGNISRTERHNHEPEVKFGIPVASEISEPCIRTLDDLKGKLQRAGSPEDKVDISLDFFFENYKKDGHSWDTFHCCCNWIYEDFLKEMLPNRKAVPCKPDSPTEKYFNTPKGFTAFVSTGDYNSCLYQSVSLLLVGEESLYKLLRLMTAVFAALHFEMAAKQIMEQLNYERKDVHYFYCHHLNKEAFEKLHANNQDTKDEEWNKIYLQELIMETPVLNEMSSQIHAMFLCGAIGRPIRQYLQAQHKDYMFHDELDPKACFNDGSYDESLPDLCIMWVNNENDPNKDINHVVPLWKVEEEVFHCVRLPAEATAVKSIMATQEDTKHNTENSEDDTDKNNYKRDADYYDDDEDVDDDDEKDQLL